MPTKNSANQKAEYIPVQEIVPEEVSELDLYSKREKIYTRRIQGYFQRIRLYTGWPLLLGFFLLPWFNWEGRQIVLFDLPARQFHITGLTFWPQDFSLLAWLLIIAAFSLFLITVFAGRVWCGYTCPQTVWTAIFMWIEQFTEGTRNQRIKLDKANMSKSKFFRKTAKHSMWLGFAFMTGFAFVSYFYPARAMAADILHLNMNAWGIFWLGFFTWVTYLNAGWLREQVCMYMCPYARFQSVMFDPDTLIVSYDPKRGEQRGARKKNQTKEEHGMGDCVDCQLCVQVCPTGIDIRDGLQYQCIGCALCIDACDSIMEKMNYPKGLISYTTEHQLNGGKTHFARPRLIGYALCLIVMISLFSYRVAGRTPLEIDVIRDRNALYTTTSEGYIENIYTVKVINMDQNTHSYRLTLKGPESMEIIGNTEITAASGEVVARPLRLRMDPGLLRQQTNTVYLTVESTTDSGLSDTTEVRFLAPRVR